MAMVKNEGVRARAVVWPGPTSLTPRKKAQTRSSMGITRPDGHCGAGKCHEPIINHYGVMSKLLYWYPISLTVKLF